MEHLKALQLYGPKKSSTPHWESGYSLQESEVRSEQSFNRRGGGMNASQAKKLRESTQSKCSNHQAFSPTSSAETARSSLAWRSEEFSKNLTS